MMTGGQARPARGDRGAGPRLSFQRVPEGKVCSRRHRSEREEGAVHSLGGDAPSMLLPVLL